ncbi:lipopolysaccharide-induced tumor necrosis factor-alpha factor homolog [Bradysia coprophila]|uniref:lipopolysaccharide-induced tumor necrosis factor-alpha factor homolog n=1 Tax=Bradysia coprophila TaxID=38358 RepID=UPI00187DD5B6|nr:lipopolysaccharide-induced tumor necrosis factor-alpha factor homolog [Bradysia coprophila]
MANPENFDSPPPYSTVTAENEKNLALVSQDSVLNKKPEPAVQTVDRIIYVGTQPVGPKPAVLVCPSCYETIQTKVKKRASSNAHMACLLLGLFGFYLCCCIPYCMKSFKNFHHSCPHCGAYVGQYQNH